MELVLRGRYLPQSVLGQGGFGTAFLAIDIDSPTRSKCVVKLFQPPVTLNDSQMETALTLFAREAQVLERLGRRHPQIPNLYAYFPLPVTSPLTNKSEELFYLVQEFIDGEDLEKVRDRQGKLSEAAVVEILREILGVLDFVHAEGAIHRDVKPSNIMQGSDGRLSLLDFGAVKEVTTPNSAQRGPTTICSPEYAPPEQIMNGQVNATSDLYALAATCLVLLTDKDSNELRDSASNSWQWRSSASVSPALADVLDKMLMARPSDRFPSAKAVLSALDATRSASSMPSPSVSMATPRANPRPAPSPASSSAPRPAPAPGLASNSPIGSPLPTSGQAASGQIAPNTPNAPIPASAPPMSMIQFLSSAAFMGAEGGLLAIAAFSLLGTSLFGGAAWLLMVGALFFLQLRRTIEGKDLVIIAGLTLAAVLFFGALNSGISGGTPLIILTMVMAAGGVVAIAIIFRLIFRLVSRIM